MSAHLTCFWLALDQLALGSTLTPGLGAKLTLVHPPECPTTYPAGPLHTLSGHTSFLLRLYMFYFLEGNSRAFLYFFLSHTISNTLMASVHIHGSVVSKHISLACISPLKSRYAIKLSTSLLSCLRVLPSSTCFGFDLISFVSNLSSCRPFFGEWHHCLPSCKNHKLMNYS